MTMFSGGFFGGGTKETKQTTTTVNQNQDQRVAIGGSAGTVVAPGAAIVGMGGGSVNAAPLSTVQQTITSSGMSGDQVRALLDDAFSFSAEQSGALADIAGSLTASMGAGSSQLGSIVAATKAPEQTALNSLLPVLVVVAIVLLLWRS
jgi:hypothetical protein